MVSWLRRSTRSLMANPGFTVPALAILALGMTAATAIFTIVDSIAFRPLGLPESHRLVIVCEDHPRLQGLCIGSPGNVDDLRTSSTTLSDLGIGRSWPYALVDEAGTRGVNGGLATAGFLRALGVAPEMGRLFRDDEVGPDGDGVVILSHATWTTRYGADPQVLGRTLQLDGEPYEIVGVMPAAFDVPFGLDDVALWKPPHFDPLDPEVRSWRGFRAIGRLAPDASTAAASAELASLYRGIGELHDEVDDEWRLRVEPVLAEVVGDARPVLLAFLGGAGLLLLVVCANVANLLLVRGLRRRRELALRAALGASRGTLVRDMVGESLVLAGVATAVAWFLAAGATRGLLALAPAGIPRVDEVAMDGRVLAFAAVMALAATLAFSLVPALRTTGWDLGAALRTGGRDGSSATASRLRSGLLVVELAVSVVLLAGAGLLTRSFAAWLDWDPGFAPEGLVAVSAFLDTSRYPSRDDWSAFWRRAEEEVGALPEVAAVATASAGPLFGGGDGSTPFQVEGEAPAESPPAVAWFDVGPGFFGTLGLPMVEGRELAETDAEGPVPSAVVNQAFVRAAGLSGPMAGRMVRLPELGLSVEVVGVVADVPPMTPGEAPRAEVYWSNRQAGRPATFFLVRGRNDLAPSTRRITDALLSIDPDLSLGTPFTLEASAARARVRPRFQALVLTALALAALALSAVGVYAVVSYTVARRVREMGVRMALGARGLDVAGMVVRSSLAVGITGVAVGTALFLIGARFLGGLVHGVAPTDPWSLGGAAVVLLAFTAVAALVPAVRAARSDPLAVMRGDG